MWILNSINLIDNSNPEETFRQKTIKYLADKWKTKSGKAVIIVSGFAVTSILLYTVASAISIVGAKPQKSDHSRVIPFQVISDRTEYDENVNTWLKYVTATVSLQLRDLCHAGGDMTWDTMQGILLNCPELKPDKESITNHTEATYTGKLVDNMATIKKWLMDNIVSVNDNDLLNAVRIHDNEITEVIQFVTTETVDLQFLPNSVSKSTSLLDIGMVLFPTKQTPYLKLYRLQLTGTFSGSKFMAIPYGQERTLTAIIDSLKYYPRDELLQRINPEYVDKTIARFEDTLTA